jgi:hypothetical protein
MIKKIIFHTHIARAFRTTLIGHLYELCQVYPTILLSEKLDPETEEVLKNKELFPKLEKIIPIEQFTKRNLLLKNRYIFQLAKKVIEEYKPNIVITATDMYPFEMYLMRFAKKINALNIAIQPFNIVESKITEKWVDLINSYLRFPSFLPFKLRMFLVKCRKYFGHFLYYWILPLTVEEKPFFGKSSYILRKGNSGMRDADYQIVFSKRDYDIYLKDGVPAEKLYILDHPLARRTRKFFERVYFNKAKKYKKDKKIVILMLPEAEIGFKRKDLSLISKEEREKNWIEIIRLVSKIFSEWKVYIKPHPDIKNVNKIKENFESLSENIEVVNPQEPADKYIEIGDVIIGLPLSASTALFTASLQCPEKPIISLDFLQEILGDCYKNFEGIEYIDSEKKFINILELIGDNKYKKKQGELKEEELREKEFSDTIELIEYLFQLKK